MPENDRNADPTPLRETPSEDTEVQAAEPAADQAGTAPTVEPEAAKPEPESAAEGQAAEAERPAEPETAAEAENAETARQAAEPTPTATEPVAEQPAAAAVTDEPVAEGAATREATAAEQPPAEPTAEQAAEPTPTATEPVAEQPAAATVTDEPVAEGEEPAAAAATAEAPAVEAAQPAETPGAPVPWAPPPEPAKATAPGAAAEAAAPAAEPEPPPEEPEEIKALRAAKEAGAVLEGKVIGWNRGGFHVALEGGITAFCPNSEIEIGRPRAPETYVDRTLAFHVIKVQRRGRRVVLSREAVLKEERQRLLAELRQKAGAGAVLKGRVSSITDFGAFVDLGGLEGLVHVSELSRRRVGHPKNAVELGQEVEVKVLKIEQDGERVSLSMKALEPDPWQGVAERYPAGSEFSGKIVRKTDFGLFVELEPEIDGLVHLSRLPPGVEIDDPSLAVGETVGGWVQEVEPRRQRVSLSLRAIPKGDPWRGIDERLAEGAAIEGTVESTTEFGVFVNLEPGLTGLLPASELGLPRGTNPARLFSPGQKVKVQVVGIDRRRKRISLAREGAKIEGSKADYHAYRKRQQEDAREGLSAMAAAFAKLKGEREAED